MILYTDGCSMTEGTELFTEHYPEFIPHRSLVVADCAALDKLGFNYLSNYNRTHCFPYLIANKLDWSLMNGASGGSGNEVIAYRTVTNLTYLLEDYSANEIVALINWTDILRRANLEPSRLSNLIPFSPTTRYDSSFKRHYLEHLTTHIEHEFLIGILILLNSMNSVRSFCDKAGIKLLMTHSLNFNSGQSDKSRIRKALNTQYWQDLFDLYIDTDNVFYFDRVSKTKNVEDLLRNQDLGSFIYFCQVNNFPLCPYYHPGSEAHAAWGRVLLEEMYKRKIV